MFALDWAEAKTLVMKLYSFMLVPQQSLKEEALPCKIAEGTKLVSNHVQ